MPLNLSALIRYKALNNCFSSIRRYTIEELVDRCSDALTEYKGMPTSVSERTVREDIKNMRSELLGFNAPIEQKDGYYFYSDKSYDLLNQLISEQKLVNELIEFLEELLADKKDITAQSLLLRLKMLNVEKIMLDIPDEDACYSMDFIEKAKENVIIEQSEAKRRFKIQLPKKKKKTILKKARQDAEVERFMLDSDTGPIRAWNAFGEIMDVLEPLMSK